MSSRHSDLEHSQIDWERHFNPRVAVPNSDQIMGERKRMSALIRGRRPFVAALRYGEATRSTLDVFPAETSTATLVFIHGGYWRAGAAHDNSAIAEHFCDAGVAVFLVNYTLCPDSTVPESCSSWDKRSVGSKRMAATTGHPPIMYTYVVSLRAHILLQCFWHPTRA